MSAVGIQKGLRVQEQVATLLRQVQESARAAAANQINFFKLDESIMQLEEYVCSLHPQESGTVNVADGLSPEITAELNDAYCLWETGLEDQFARKLIQGEALFSDYPYYDRFGTLVRRELALVSISGAQHILLLGSGSFPVSAIHAHLQTRLPVDCVVRDSSTINLARQVLEKCGFNGAVRLLSEGGTGYCVSDYDVILIEHLANPKKSILRNLRKRSRPGCQILCRTSQRLRMLLCDPIQDRDVRGFHIKSQLKAENGQSISTLLLEPARSAASGVRLEWLSGVDSDTAIQLLRLMNRTLKEETTIGFPGPIDEQTGHSLMKQMDADVRSGHRHVLVAFKDGAIVGQLILTPNSSPNHRHIVELTRGTIHPSFRGGGLALLAFQEVANKCVELGRELICLDVRAGTMAAMWWQHFGFRPYGLLADYSRVGGKTYQGLYLFQSTGDLQQRLKELAHDSGPTSSSSPGWPG